MKFKSRFDDSTRKLLEASWRFRRLLKLCRHDLRTPPGTIKTASQLVLAGKCGEMTPEIEKLVSMMSSNADKALTLIELVTSLVTVEPEWIPLPLVELDVKAFLTERLAGRAAEVTYAESPRVQADREKLSVVVDYLLDDVFANAVDGAPVEIHVSTVEGRRKTDSGRLLRISIGVENRRDGAQLTQRFDEALESALETLDDLTLCREVCRLHGGNLNFAGINPYPVIDLYLPRLT